MASSGAGTWDPLSEEELKFCWQCIVQHGQLTVPNLQKFMLMVTGEEMTFVQARDLLGYLDASGDGRVGMEEFRHFMSASELQRTTPKQFMWSPTKLFREEHGLASPKAKQAAAAAEAPPAVTNTRRSIAEVDEVELGLLNLGEKDPAQQEEEKKGPPMEPVQEKAKSTSRPGTQSDRGSSRAGQKPGAKGKAAAKPKAGGRNSADGGNVKPSVQESSIAKRRISLAKEEDGAVDELMGVSTTSHASGDPTHSGANHSHKPQNRPGKDEKSLLKIEECLTRYEAKTWAQLHEDQKEIRRKLFQQFAQTNPNELDSTEFHKMLMKLHKLARTAMPGELRAGDTLATLQYVVGRDAEMKQQQSGAGEKEKGEKPAEKGGQEQAADLTDEELKLTYQMWYDLMSGKFRPEVSHQQEPSQKGRKASSSA
eukprot:TRINITY_DN12337_c0_g1_i1.p1 TRINITY_DN12337_c0_g1~~TRINITY_DN12337_c0_g1_i1.p1  ORF type:complete len:442 (+),score=106.74 TRINITY_DN12337_c0_g1_i1:54-1328(+)